MSITLQAVVGCGQGVAGGHVRHGGRPREEGLPEAAAGLRAAHQPRNHCGSAQGEAPTQRQHHVVTPAPFIIFDCGVRMDSTAT